MNNYFGDGDNKLMQFFSKKNYKENITFKIWLKHYEPFLEDIFYEFKYICKNNDINIFDDNNTKEDFYLMLYNSSSGYLVDKNDFPYQYGLKNYNEEIKKENIEYQNQNNKENNFTNNNSNYLYSDDDDDFPSRI